MGSAELDSARKLITIHSHIITYGNAADPTTTENMREEIETLWNEPRGVIHFKSGQVGVVFRITAAVVRDIDPVEIFSNLDPRINYFRIEEFALGNISFVDGLGCNTGYFKLENLYKGSTTAAHEFGHTLGLNHPEDLDLRGKGIPGIMYPRGTLVDPPFQYDPAKPAGQTGGTMHPMYRKVHQQDIDNLKIGGFRFENNRAIIGEFTNIWHDEHQKEN